MRQSSPRFSPNLVVLVCTVPKKMHWSLRLAVDSLRRVLSQSYSEELAQCGEEYIHLLQNAANSLTVDHCLGPEFSRELDQIIEQAYSNMLATHGADPIQWRRLYSDASILRSLADLTSSESPDEQTAASCIARLDHALVIAGAPGRGMWTLIQNLILSIQATCLPREPFERSPKPDFIPIKPLTDSSLPVLATSSNAILTLGHLPSLSFFRSDLVERPFILTGFALDWPAMNEHPWHSIRYLRSVAGRGRVVPVEVGDDYRSNDWTQRMMPWDDFLDALEKDSSHAQPILYMAQHNLLSQFPPLREDILVPDYVFAAPQAPATYPLYRPPDNEEELVLSAWLGPGGTVSPAHTDPFFNSYAQVVGRKTVWLAPPTSSVTEAMYPYPPPSPTSDSESARYPAANQLAPSMTNTTQVDVFSDQDRDRFPLFWKYAVPEALSATLEPGDVLFFPPGWWHAMRSEERCFSVSMWF